MASPNLVPIDFSPGGDTFQYFVELTNNIVSLVNTGVYTNGNPTSANANVVITGSLTSTYLIGSGNNTNISLYNDNGLLTGQIYPNSNNNSIVITSSNTANKLELFSNGAVFTANVRIATVNDLNSISNTIGNTINTAVNNALTAAYAYTDLAVPAGVVIAFAGNTAPTGWYECDGTAKSRTTDVNLFASIGTIYGSGNGSNTFNIPNLQGEFIRGWDHGRGVDTGRTLGSFQSDSIKSHTHTGTTVSAGDHTHTASTASAGDHNHTITDPGHTHTVNDPGHSHSIHDPGHSHPVLGGTSTSGQGYVNTGAGTNNLNVYTSTAGTGISVNSSGTNISINGAKTNISLANAGSHTHTVTVTSAGAHSHTFTTNSTGDVETRPRNVAMMYIIKR